MAKRKTGKRGRRARRPAAEYFLAATGLALVAFVIALALSYRSCEFTVPGVVPAPAATPTHTPS